MVVLLAVGSAGLTALFERHAERRAADELSADLDQLLAGIERSDEGALEVSLPPADQRYHLPLSGRYWQVEIDGVTTISRSLWDTTLELPLADAVLGALRSYDIEGPEGEGLLVLERRAVLQPALGGGNVRAVVAMDRIELRAAARSFLRDLSPFLCLLGVMLVAGGWVQVAIGLKPLAAVGERVVAVRSGAASRLGDGFPGEVQPLVAEVDALIASREVAVAKARTRASDLAHALKTPLQALIGEADRLRNTGNSESAESIEDIAQAIERHVQRELSRARIAATGWAASCSPTTVIAPLVRVLQRTPDGQRLRWVVEGAENVRARIDSGDLTEALGGLLENAARHARTEVRVRVTGAAQEVRIAVRDDGKGVPDAELARLRLRGARLDISEPGSGLGLAITSEICEAAGGELLLGNVLDGFESIIRLRGVAEKAAS